MNEVISKLTSYQYSQNDVFLTASDYKQLKMIEGQETDDVITLHRGINCLTKEIRDDVLSGIESNNFTKGALIASFSSDVDSASQFAHSEMSNFPTESIMNAQQIMEQRQDFVTGYCGLVVSAKFKRSDVLDVSKLISSSESEFLVPNSAIPMSVTVNEITPFYRMICESDKSVHEHLVEALEMRDSLLIKHIAASWSDYLTIEDSKLLSSAMNTLPYEQSVKILESLPNKFMDSEMLSFVTSPVAIQDMMNKKIINSEIGKIAMKRIASDCIQNHSVASFTLKDFEALHKMQVIEEKFMDKAIGETLRSGDHDKAISLTANYGYSRTDVISALFKKELTKHQQEISQYLDKMSGKERLSENVVVLNRDTQSYELTTQAHTLTGFPNALFRYTSYYQSIGDVPESLGCSMVGSKNLFKLMAQYPNLPKADQIRADIVLTDVMSAINEIKGVDDRFPGFDKSTTSTLTRYPKTPFRSHLIDSLMSGSATKVHNLMDLLKDTGDNQSLRNMLAKHLEDNLNKIGRGMGDLSL
ncbi:hypothetical protein P7M17_09440 [Vibrio parahaemolyticus]|nr:hypothetical protein [Vibrio parahaemolyticus]TBT51761.1 hypothetical protein D5E78_08110 [Vibrio parahaemolyticus]